jgi:Domain of unknown function (DUF1864)
LIAARASIAERCAAETFHGRPGSVASPALNLRPNDPFYASIVAEKIPFVPPAQQPALRQLGDTGTLLERFESEAETRMTPQLRAHAECFLAVCRAHAAAYAFHHHSLVKPFLERPAADTSPDRYASLSASGPPLEEVMATLERLRALRTAREPLERLRALIF